MDTFAPSPKSNTNQGAASICEWHRLPSALLVIPSIHLSAPPPPARGLWVVERRAVIGWSWWTPEECLDFTQCKSPYAAHVAGTENILLLWMFSYFSLPNYLSIFLSLFLRLKQRVSVFNLRWAKMYPRYFGQTLVKDDKITWILLCIHSIRSFNFNLVCDKKPSCRVIVLLTPHLQTATTCEQFLCETISKSHLPGETPTLLRFPLPW